jgi:hypothetical protein
MHKPAFFYRKTGFFNVFAKKARKMAIGITPMATYYLNISTEH